MQGTFKAHQWITDEQEALGPCLPSRWPAPAYMNTFLSYSLKITNSLLCDWMHISEKEGLLSPKKMGIWGWGRCKMSCKLCTSLKTSTNEEFRSREMQLGIWKPLFGAKSVRQPFLPFLKLTPGITRLKINCLAFVTLSLQYPYYEGGTIVSHKLSFAWLFPQPGTNAVAPAISSTFQPTWRYSPLKGTFQSSMGLGLMSHLLPKSSHVTTPPRQVG